jgi:formamidopyrimidine-DNA glycosylase
MPELPEVETIAADVRPHLQGVTIRRAQVLRPDVLRRIRRPAFERALAGRRIVRVGRRAKHLVFELDDSARLVIQPRMTGAMLVDDEPDPYTVLRLELDSRKEACWIAKVDPSRPAHRLSALEVRRLHAAIVGVLARSIANRGTTVRDYRTGTGEPGDFQGRLAVYDRAGEPCRRCGTRIALTHALDGRATYFCHRCQR